MSNLASKIKLLVKAGVVILIAAGSIKTAFAYDTAKLQIDISGAPKDKYYLCMSNVGCVRIDSAHQTMPIDALDVRYIFVANTSTDQMYPQSLPDSCNVTVNPNQKLIVKGNLASTGNGKVHVANLHCSVV